MLNQTNIKTWLDALRSGDYKQGKSRLKATRNGEIQHCCLGIASELYAAEHPEELACRAIPGSNVYSFDAPEIDPTNGETMLLHAPVQAWLGLSARGEFEPDAVPAEDPIHEIVNTRDPELRWYLADKNTLDKLNDMGVSFEEIADFIERNPQAFDA